MSVEKNTDPRRQTELCFVYGTLKQGYGNHFVMQQAKGQYIGQAVSCTAWPLVVGQYPYLLDMPGQGRPVRGEIYQVRYSAGWRLLDKLEAHPQLYFRRVEGFRLQAGNLRDQEYQAWVYLYPHITPELLALRPIEEYRE